jgi:hypothetical protein
MKAKLIKVWEEDATNWTPERREAIRFAKKAEDEDTLFCVHPIGTVFEGQKASVLVSVGFAEWIIEATE